MFCKQISRHVTLIAITGIIVQYTMKHLDLKWLLMQSKLIDIDIVVSEMVATRVDICHKYTHIDTV